MTGPPPPVVPIRQVWGREYVKDFERRRQGLESELGAIYARKILRVDHTGAVAREMRSLAGKWIVNLANEDNQIATFGLVLTSARGNMSALVQSLRDRHISAGVDRPRLLYIDRDCCSENGRKFWNENWAPGCVLKLDISHFLQRITSAVSSVGGPNHVLYNRFCADLVSCVYAENADDLAGVITAVARTAGQGPAGAEVSARRLGDFRKLVRRRVPEADVLEDRLLRFIALYKDQRDPNGNSVLHERALSCIERQLLHVRRGCVSDPPDGAFVRDGVKRIRGNGLVLEVARWRSLRGTSQLEGFHPLQSQTMSGTNVGPKTGQAQLLEAAIRWNRGKSGGKQGPDRNLYDPKVSRRVAELQRVCGGEATLSCAPAETCSVPEEYGPAYLLTLLGAGPSNEVETSVDWSISATSSKCIGPDSAHPKKLSRAGDFYPCDRTPEMISAFEALFAETQDPEEITVRYNRRYYLVSGGSTVGGSGYFRTNANHVRKWCNVRLQRVAANAMGTPESAAARGMLLESFQDSPTGRCGEKTTPVGSLSMPPPTAPPSRGSVGKMSPLADESVEIRPPLRAPNPKQGGSAPPNGETAPSPLSSDTPGSVGKRRKGNSCALCGESLASAFHPGHARLPGRVFCENSTQESFCDWLEVEVRKKDPRFALTPEDRESEIMKMENRRSSWNRSRNRGAPIRPDPAMSVANGSSQVGDPVADPAGPSDGDAPLNAKAPKKKPRCPKCGNYYSDLWHAGSGELAGERYCPLSGEGYGAWQNRRLREKKMPELDEEAETRHYLERSEGRRNPDIAPSPSGGDMLATERPKGVRGEDGRATFRRCNLRYDEQFRPGNRVYCAWPFPSRVLGNWGRLDA